MHSHERLRNDIGQATQDTVATCETIGDVILVESREDRKILKYLANSLNDLARVAGTINCVFCTTDTWYLLGYPSNELRREIRACSCRKVI